jgi:hypothetical protein
MRPDEFGKVAGRVFRLEDVTSADFSRIEDLQASVTLRDGQTIEARDIDALELAYAIKPSVVEGKRLAYARHAWVFHNLVGHPLMQLLALFGAYRLAFRVHDATAPRARGAKPRSNGQG